MLSKSSAIMDELIKKVRDIYAKKREIEKQSS
jgi:hypothetical protein